MPVPGVTVAFQLLIPAALLSWQCHGIDHSRAASAPFIAAAIYAWKGHRPFYEEPVDLAFPMRGGTYYIVSGGSNALMNLHFMTPSDERFRRLRGQSNAVDIVKLNRDRANLAGNFVAIDCGGVRVVLAHLKQGSVLVKTGEAVTESRKPGRIGNCGNTDEPHLHIHAGRPVDMAKLPDAEPVPIRFDGRMLARNGRVRTW